MAEFKLEQAVTAIRIGITHATGPIVFAATPCKISSSFVTVNADTKDSNIIASYRTNVSQNLFGREIIIRNWPISHQSAGLAQSTSELRDRGRGGKEAEKAPSGIIVIYWVNYLFTSAVVVLLCEMLKLHITLIFTAKNHGTLLYPPVPLTFYCRAAIYSLRPNP